MTLKTDIASDYTEFDGVETVTVTPQNPTGSTFTASALQRLISIHTMAMLGGTLGNEEDLTMFEFFQASMGSNKVKTGYHFAAASGNYVINQADYSNRTSRWRCICTRKR